MKAYAYVDQIGIEHLRPVERPDPKPGPLDVVLKMRAVALNYRDLAIARRRYHIGVTAPLVPLSDGAGEVVEIGSKVTRVKVGDLACPTYLPDWIDGRLQPNLAVRRLGGPSDGVLAEYLCLSEEEVVRAPVHLDPSEAATLPVAAVTAWQSLFERGVLRPGDLLSVQGTGGVSAAAILLGRAAGAEVAVTTRSSAHTEALKDLGAHIVLDGAGADWPNRLLHTARRGAAAVVDVAGGQSLGRSIAATRVGGQVHLVGYAAETEASIDIFDAIRHAVTIHVAAAGHRRSFEEAVKAFELHRLRPPVARAFEVTEIVDALNALKDGGHLGKLVLTF